MATRLDYLRARVLAYKVTLDGKPSKEKKDRVSVQIAEQFNGILEDIKKESPEAAPHLPQPITMNSMAARDFQLSDANFIELEMMLNGILAVLEVARGSH
jgi:hypothetical protein